MRSRSTVLCALVAVTGATALAAAPVATAAPAAANAVLAADVPMTARGEGMSVVWFGSLRIDDGKSVTCLTASNPSGGDGRIRFTTDYEMTAGVTYGVSAWETGKCSTYIEQTGRWSQSLGGVTVTPTAADVSDGVYEVRIP
ncbi:hypothetical protein ACFWWT_16400 [Streptomyces sp. NPDC058676]|uniref:hypothetical protein n=1 Tax=unclassified Streptomyces TaxID=2593676 RepID=UPI00365D1E57